MPVPTEDEVDLLARYVSLLHEAETLNHLKPSEDDIEELARYVSLLKEKATLEEETT